jgi:hypothetical protein
MEAVNTTGTSSGDQREKTLGNTNESRAKWPS